MTLRKLILLGVLSTGSSNIAAETLYSADFQDANINAWSTSGNGNASASLYSGNYSLRVNRTLSAQTTISTLGYEDVTISLDLAAYSLERTDRCYVESSSDGGISWSTLLSIGNGDDNSSFFAYDGSPANIDNNSNFTLRVRAAGNRNNDYCYLDNIVVEGTIDNNEPVGSAEILVQGATNFGNVTINTSSTSVFSVSNIGDADLTIANINDLSSPFSISNNNCANTVLIPGNSCNLTVNFSPSSVGSFNDDLLIASNDSDQPTISVNIEGNGLEEDEIDCQYDCLTGNGTVNRNLVTYSNLTGNAGNGSLVNFSAFAIPDGAANPTNTFEGTLAFNGVQRGWTEVYDPYLYDTLSGIKQLPNFNYQFIQHGTHLIPQTRGLIESASALGQWDLILEPGRVWDENSDNGFSRASLPFALVEYNQNCTHNGVLTFLFNDEGDISNVQYQIASETCAYYQFNLYGRLSAQYIQESLSAAADIKSAYESEVSNRMPIKAISALASDYPNSGVNINNIASEQAVEDLSLFGVVFNNVHYVGGCETRYGTYPFCDVMTIPSYSTAKSTVGALSLMRLEQKYPGAKNATIRNNVAECTNNTKWANVTLEDALDMATGNYDSANYEADETNYAVNWLYSNTHNDKVDIACNFYDHKEAAGQTWVYHSSDTYLVGRGVNNYLQTQEGNTKEYFTDMLVTEIYTPLKLSPSMSESIRTRDTESAAVAALGLFYHRDDVVKLANMLNNDDGMINGEQILDPAMLSAALQRTANDRGLPTDPTQAISSSNYNNGFWSYDLSASTVMQNCNNETWIPYMSGYGGIGIQMLPNGMTYYFFSDGFDYSFTTTLNELNKVSSLCN
ncbi:choice-of-anchor D domain-containing protein [Colwelliaceae bacterium MEBiC 14330]